MTDTMTIWSAFERLGFFSNMRENFKDSENKHSHEGAIQDIPLKKILKKLDEEYSELKTAIKSGSSSEIKDESCDLANMCGLLFCHMSLGGIENENL